MPPGAGGAEAAGIGVQSVTAEPRMEDLLASIRKAIQDDIGEVPASLSAQSAGTLYKGAVRELHVKVGEEAGSAAAEIQELRERISRNRAADMPQEAVFPPARKPVPPRTSSFATTLAGELEARQARAEAQAVPPLRQSYAERDLNRYEGGLRDHVRRGERDIEVAPRSPQAAWAEEPSSYRAAPEPAHVPGAAMMAADTAAAAGAAFQRLADTILTRATSDRSIEDMTRDLLRGMLKQWLDDNLPALVERLVREEIERVARRGR